MKERNAERLKKQFDSVSLFEVYDELNGCDTFLLGCLQIRLQAQAAGVPYQDLSCSLCFESNLVCELLFSDSFLSIILLCEVLWGKK